MGMGEVQGGRGVGKEGLRGLDRVRGGIRDKGL